MTEYSAINYEAVTVSTTAVSITSTITGGGATRRGQRALVSIETDAIRFRYDGTAPTSTEGHAASAGDRLIV